MHYISKIFPQNFPKWETATFQKMDFKTDLPEESFQE